MTGTVKGPERYRLETTGTVKGPEREGPKTNSADGYWELVVMLTWVRLFNAADGKYQILAPR